MDTRHLPTDLSQAAIDAVGAVTDDRAFLHDDPAAYRAGARDALAAVVRLAPPAAENE